MSATTTTIAAPATTHSTGADLTALLGRLMLAALFLPAGISKLTGFAGTVAYIQSVGMPMPTIAAAIAALVEIGGALALIVGWRVRLVAPVLALFTVVASLYFHAYWSAPADMRMMQTLLFNKNIAVAGGLLVLAALGAGRLALDARRA